MESKPKQIVVTGTMSNLVGMWAFIWDGDSLKKRVFIMGKADDQHYIVQAINSLTGATNVCKLVHIKDMLHWTFYPTRELADECYNDWCDQGVNRYKLDF